MKILTACFAYNEGDKIRRTVARHPKDRPYDLLVMDDGSTDGSIEKLPHENLLLLRNDTNQGIGAAIKRVFEFALENGYDLLVTQAGNDKDDPSEISRLLQPLLRGEADFVQGSRYSPGGAYGNTPLYRIIGTRYVHPLLFSLITRKKLTETTNGFRAFRTTILRDPRVAWKQEWLDKYELEPYLMFKALQLGYRHVEVPVTKIYPSREESYTKMRPITGWWSIFRPIVLLGLGIKQ
jgi:dolichol-phosphate mannosyltransferase